ncbi:type II toxin-antitoxin system PemK/MazF family toxin, partial [Brevibacterium rongguiense]|uniref:type II toxin-antitoxin system PemK/MazF family toxin n=2 Tax=Brevibacterium TaxID=1696 RepID=UPI001928C7A6
ARGGTARRPGAGTRARGDRATGAQVRAGGDYQPARPGTRSGPKQGAPRRPSGGYPGDFSGSIRPVYTPDLDGDADPGEVVWAWVPYEEDFSRGKDRPVLIIGRDSAWLLGLMLTSRDHIPGGIGEMREADSALWMNVGTGDWDAQGRASEIRLDRVIRIAAGAVRREGAILPMGLFSQVVSNVRTS